MQQSRYEKYLVRRPVTLKHRGGTFYGDDVYIEETPKDKTTPVWSPIDTGPQVMMGKKWIPEAYSLVEYTLISGDTALAVKTDIVRPHKHTYDEIFLFMGTNPEDPSDLGAEIELWLGEGSELDKLLINTSSGLFLPRGLAHFPAFIRNVIRPFTWVVIEPNSLERNLLPVDLKGRPTYD